MFVHQALNKVGRGALLLIGYIGKTGNLHLSTDKL